jgi:AraC family transcriptional regulator of adaptative response/methylated-DNA-[protein]-cysteine methyltransferase
MEHAPQITLEATTPGKIKSIRAGVSTTPFGNYLIGETPNGICHLSFFDDGNREIAIEEMKTEWPFAEISWDNARAHHLSEKIFTPTPALTSPFKLLIHGTPFQLQILRTLLRIPYGALVSYGALATAAGFPNAARATGSAVGRNSISFLIPCHRVIRSDGNPGQYRWGAHRKRTMIAWEALHYQL